MNKILKLAILAIFTMFAVACTRIETGEVGIRVGFDKQVVREELLPGSFNQVLIGDVITFSSQGCAGGCEGSLSACV